MRTHWTRLQPRFGQTSEGDGTWLTSLSRVDDVSASLSTSGVSAQTEQHSSPARLPQDEPPTNSPTHSLLQSLRAELQRYQETTASLKSEHDALNKELDRRKDLETSEFRLTHLLAIDMKNIWPKQNSRIFKEGSSEKPATEHLWLRAFNSSRANYAR